MLKPVNVNHISIQKFENIKKMLWLRKSPHIYDHLMNRGTSDEKMKIGLTYEQKTIRKQRDIIQSDKHEINRQTDGK